MLVKDELDDWPESKMLNWNLTFMCVFSLMEINEVGKKFDIDIPN